jgi:hypothetical protein
MYILSTVAQVLPNDVIIIFGKGKQFVKVNKYPLCAASRFFTQMLDGLFLVKLFIINVSLTETNLLLSPTRSASFASATTSPTPSAP